MQYIPPNYVFITELQEVKDEERRKAVMNLELCGEKAIMETQIGVQRG